MTSTTMATLVSTCPSPYISIPVCLTLFLTSLIIYRLYLHPLAKVPGPRLAAITSLWYVYHVKKSRMLVFNRELHKKYGPAVRITPNEVSFDSKEAFQAIYTGSHYIQKGEFYYAFSNNPGRIDWRFRRHLGDAFSFNGELNIQRYRSHRKNIGTTYAASSLKKYDARLDEVMDRFVAKLKTREGDILDVTDCVHIAIVECLGAVSLNWSPGFIEDETDHGFFERSIGYWREVTTFAALQQWLLVVQKWPSLRPRIAKLLGVEIKPPAGYIPFEPRVFGVIRERTAKFLASSEKPEKATDPTQDPDLLAELLQVSTKKPEWKPDYASHMAGLNFIAGHETTTSIATSALVSICSDPKIKARVQAELSAHSRPRAGDGNGTVDVDVDLDQCKYTQACMKETLRLHPVTSLALWRKVPAGPPLRLHGLAIPPGTTVGADAALFRPERWLEGDAEQRRVLERVSLAWGGGAHTCAGRHLAEMILGKVVPGVMRRFDVEVVERPPVEAMRSFSYVAIPTGVKARFRVRGEGEKDGKGKRDGVVA
ncbi:cytochrome P450 [Hypoxylon sp. NC1633]|nr:cytochrome P450 [Hypoxylon sp. NC1633]